MRRLDGRLLDERDRLRDVDFAMLSDCAAAAPRLLSCASSSSSKFCGVSTALVKPRTDVGRGVAWLPSSSTAVAVLLLSGLAACDAAMARVRLLGPAWLIP